MKVGLYFGSFNPIHVGHLIIANYIVSLKIVDQLWFVLSPQNPLKTGSNLLNEYHRQFLLQSAIEGEKNLRCSTIEFQLPKPSYTIDTLAYLEENYPGHNFSIIMGSDSFQNISKWKNSQLLVSKYPFLIYIRPGFDVKNNVGVNVEIVKAPLLDISSTIIRERIKNGISVRFFVPDVVHEEIVKNHYYKTGPFEIANLKANSR